MEQALLLGTRGAFIHECKELGLTTGNSGAKRRSSLSNASGLFEKLKTNIFQAFDDVQMETFFEVRFFLTTSSQFNCISLNKNILEIETFGF